MYAARARQLDDKAGGVFDITWISLGDSVCESELWLAAKVLRFGHIFSVQEPTRLTSSIEMCKDGHRPVNTDASWECLKVKPGMEKYASRFETRRYAALLGATTEWSKWEGITYSPRRRKLFTAISSIQKGMEDFRKKLLPDDRLGYPKHIELQCASRL